MMARKRSRDTAACKIRVASETVQGGNTIRRLSSDREVHARSKAAWKRQACIPHKQ